MASLCWCLICPSSTTWWRPTSAFLNTCWSSSRRWPTPTTAIYAGSGSKRGTTRLSAKGANALPLNWSRTESGTCARALRLSWVPFRRHPWCIVFPAQAFKHAGKRQMCAVWCLFKTTWDLSGICEPVMVFISECSLPSVSFHCFIYLVGCDKPFWPAWFCSVPLLNARTHIRTLAMAWIEKLAPQFQILQDQDKKISSSLRNHFWLCWHPERFPAKTESTSRYVLRTKLGLKMKNVTRDPFQSQGNKSWKFMVVLALVRAKSTV